MVILAIDAQHNILGTLPLPHPSLPAQQEWKISVSATRKREDKFF